MALSRVPGEEDIYVSGVFALRKAALLREHNITAILSVIDYSLTKGSDIGNAFAHLSIDVDDMDDVDILVHFPRMVRFIERSLYGEQAESASSPVAPALSGAEAADDVQPALVPAAAPHPRRPQAPGAVLVHCAMGKSRSVSAVVAYLLWKHPHRYSTPESAARSRRRDAAPEVVANALRWVQQARPIAEPNPGFMQQLALWWAMGCPCESEDAVERHPKYKRWLYERELEESRATGRAPGWVVFEDEEPEQEGRDEEEGARGDIEVRCKKCRRVLATQGYLVAHRSGAPGTGKLPPCPHIFVEALSWMRPTLETEALDGRLICPNTKCGATIGRFAWQGFKCSCGEWVSPAFSLNKAKVDEGRVRPSAGAGHPPGTALGTGQSGIRVPPGQGAAGEDPMPRENL